MEKVKGEKIADYRNEKAKQVMLNFHVGLEI